MNPALSYAAAAFYVALACVVVGAMRAARAGIERRGSDRIGLVLLAAGTCVLALAVVVYARGPHRMLPF